MKTCQDIIAFLNRRIDEHDKKIEQAVKENNHYMKTLFKAERAEACAIRSKILNEMG